MIVASVNSDVRRNILTRRLSKTRSPRCVGLHNMQLPGAGMRRGWPLAAIARARTWRRWRLTGFARQRRERRCAACFFFIPSQTRPRPATFPIPRMRPGMGWRRTPCAGFGSNTRPEFHPTIQMRHRCSYRNRLPSRRSSSRQRSTTFCATRASPTRRSCRRPG